MRSLPALCIILLFSSHALAKQHPFYGYPQGITHYLSSNELSIYIDKNRILKNIPRLKKIGLFDTNLSSTEVGFYETQLAALISIPYVIKMIQGLYSSNIKNDQINIKSYMLTTDLYGNNIRSFCYSFTFNRQLYQKINWKNFQTYNFVKIAPDFETSEACKPLEETAISVFNVKYWRSL